MADKMLPRRARVATSAAAVPAAVVPAVALAAAHLVLLVLWLQARPWRLRTSSGAAVLGALSGITGLAGTLLIAITLVLSARWRAVERPLGGLDRVYRLHHYTGAIGFALVALHPALLSWRYAQFSVVRAAHHWFPSTEWARTAGQVALYGMAPAMVVTLFVTVRHQVLVWTQRLLGILFVPAAYHALYAGGDTLDSKPLRVYMAFVVVLGLAALVYHTLLGRFLVRHHGYRVSRVQPREGGITDVVLVPTGAAMRYVPGQFAFLRFRHSPIGAEPHPFSMSSAPGEDLRFSIKRLGDYTSHIGEVEPGTEAQVEGPYGRFSYRFVRRREQVWVGGGVGIAPFLAMARSLPPTGYSIDLYYCFPDDEQAPFLDELRDLARSRPRLRLQALCDVRDGFVDADVIAERSGRLGDKEFLLCGPPAMMHALQEQLVARGVHASRIHFEEFQFS